ncbi:MAG: hypothetical protein ACR2H0_04230 [Candidatus Limnocylindrales bacterium]
MNDAEFDVALRAALRAEAYFPVTLQPADLRARLEGRRDRRRPWATLLGAAASAAIAVVVVLGGLRLLGIAVPGVGTSGDEWGPLAVVRTDSGAQARNEGTVVITDRCVFLEREGYQALLVWPESQTSWDEASGTIAFRRLDGETVNVSSGDEVVMGGGAGAEDAEQWVDDLPWVLAPAPECVTAEWFFVSDISISGVTCAGWKNLREEQRSSVAEQIIRTDHLFEGVQIAQHVSPETPEDQLVGMASGSVTKNCDLQQWSPAIRVRDLMRDLYGPETSSPAPPPVGPNVTPES